MTLRTGKSSRYRYHTSLISARQGETGCKDRTVSMDKLDSFVVRRLGECLLATERREKILEDGPVRPGRTLMSRN